MAVNVTQKDMTLKQVIDHIDGLSETHADEVGSPYGKGYERALREIRDYCEDNLGYSGDMPLEVPNQSERKNGR